MELYVQEAGVVYGKLHAKTMVIYMPSPQVDIPTSVPTLVPTTSIVFLLADPISVETFEIASINPPAPIDPISLLATEITTTLPTNSL